MFCALRGNEVILIINTLISNSIFRRLVTFVVMVGL